MKPNLLLLGLSIVISWTQTKSQNENGNVHSPWFEDASNYWDFDSAAGQVVQDLKGKQRSRIFGNYTLFPGPKDNALELLETKKRSYIQLGDFRQTCLPKPSKCRPGFTISFWVNLKKVLNDGVLLQLSMSRKSPGITINTQYKEGRIFLIFYGNTAKKMYIIKAELLSHIWHHVALVWNATADPKMSLFVNCTSRDDFKAKTRKITNKKREGSLGTVLILGANHAGKKAIPIAVDDFAIWFKVLKPERFCEIINQERVHGNYSSWSGYSACSVSCGVGTKTRKRVCNHPIPDYGGRNCSKLGPSSQTVECNARPCPVHGGYTPWSNFSECSASCGDEGRRYRSRNCTNPEPQYGGQDCFGIGPAIETTECGVRPCPIPGGYTPWSNFSECSISCGSGGTRYRTRNCTNPEPQYGGRNCSGIGPAIEIAECGVRPCPIPGGYTPWSNFTECSVSCGGGGTRYRTRNCTNPEPQYGGRNCSGIGPAIEIAECGVRPCPIPGGYTPWSNFSECSVSCGGGGTRYRTRNCTNPEPQYGGRNCSGIGPAIEIAECGVRPCPIPGGYTPWSNFTECSVSCGGGGTRYRTRNCTNPEPQYGGKNCSEIGKPLQIQECNLTPCPVHGNYSAWSAFTSCSASCGLGYRTRNRTCTEPAPQHGGRDCVGLDYETRTCNLSVCPIHGGYSDWSNFSVCSRTCGNSTKTRTRICNNPTPSLGGRDCRDLGPNSHTVFCDTQPCPVDGNYSNWSEFSPCSETCGNSSKFRRRFCTNPVPRFGGKNCSTFGADFEKAPCFKAPCPIHGNFSEWSEFSRCSRTCGNSVRQRYRNCTRPTPMHGGSDCSSLGTAVEVVNCDVPECPINGNYSDWSVFTSCSHTCGNGMQFRMRHCDNPQPQFGGRNCSTLGPCNETRPCNIRSCPIHGNLSEWSKFSGCNETCGSGIRTRHRYCTNPKPRYGGTNCSALGPTSDVIPCHVRPCPIHGNYSTWSPFSACSKSCDNGTQIRRRFCTKPSPRFGGRDCNILGPNVETRQCETQPCPDIDFTVTLKLNLVWNDELLDNSSYLRQNISNELKTAIFGLHKSKAIKDIKVLEFRPGSVVVSMEVIYYSRDFPGAISLHDALYENRRIGSYDVTPSQFTSTDVPTNLVQNLTAFNQSSTSLVFYWSALSTQPGQTALQGYALTYEELQWPGNLRSNETRISIFLNTTRGRLGQLKKYTWYRTRVSGMNKRGIGVPSQSLLVLTDEDVPNASPNLKPVGYNTSSTSLNVSWTAIARSDINGVLRGYTVFYKPSSSHESVRAITVPPGKLYVYLTGLRKFTEYELRVAGVTSKGTGEMSAESLVFTDEDVPSAPPVFHSLGHIDSTSILLQWYKVISNHQNGVILGYRIDYRLNSRNESWHVIRVQERETLRLAVKNLKMYTKYLFRISAFTKKGEGNISESVLVSTDEDVPCSAPEKFETGVINSTSVWLKWNRLHVLCYRGILRGYILFYKRKSESVYLNVTVPPTSNETVLDTLWKFAVYHIKIAGFTSKGLGPISQDVAVKTGEDVPSSWPQRIRAINTSSTSIHVTWDPIPRSRIHGRLRGYHIFLRRANESEWLPKIRVSESDLSTDIRNLWKYTKYVLRIVGLTTAGPGAVSPEITVRTDEDVPSHTPEQFKAINKSSPTSIPLTWKPIRDPFYIHGILRGYKIEFRMTHLAGSALRDDNDTVIHTVGPNTLSHVLTDLEIYAVYRIKIRAFTVKGDGVLSEISAETCKCASIYKTNWWTNPPYIDKNSSQISGIFPRILPRMVSTCCGFCHEHKSTITRFENHAQGTKSYRKSGVSKFRDSVGDSIELHFPMYGQVHQVKYYKQYEFIPLVESPGVAFLVLEDDAHLASLLLLDTISHTLPVVMLMIAFILVFGILMWCVESFSNKNQFPREFFPGIHQGIWWSMVSMTTIGYGDKFPRSVPGQVLGIFWILAGSIIMSLYTSVVTSHITTEVVAEKVKLYGMKVAVIQNSSEYQLAVRKNARADRETPYNNLYDIYNALANGHVKGALVDAYVLGSRKDLFDNTRVRISKIYDYSSAYGVVLAGEAKKLQKCFREYVSENRKDIFQIIEGNVHMIEESDMSASVQRSKSLIDPTFFVYKQCLFICVVLLCLALLLGILLEYFKRPLKRAFCRTNSTTDLSKKRAELLALQKTLQHEMKEELFEITQKLKRLKSKHRREIKQWIKVKKPLRRDRLLTDDSLVYSASVVRYDEPYLSPLLQLRKLIHSSSNNSDENNHYSPVESQCEETVV